MDLLGQRDCFFIILYSPSPTPWSYGQMSFIYTHCYSPDSVYHLKTHVDTVDGMTRPRYWKARDTVVTVAEDLDSHALVVLYNSQALQHAHNTYKHMCRGNYQSFVWKHAIETYIVIPIWPLYYQLITDQSPSLAYIHFNSLLILVKYPHPIRYCRLI